MKNEKRKVKKGKREKTGGNCFVLFSFLIVLSSCVTASSGNSESGGISLQDVIEQSAGQMATELPRDSIAVVVAFESAREELSEYIMEELTYELKTRGIKIVERQELKHVLEELNFQMSLYVSEESARSVGKFLGASVVIIGQLTNLGGVYRFRTNAIDVETAVRVSITRFDIQDDRELRRMIGE